MTDETLTMPTVAKKKPNSAQESSDSKKPQRSPSWTVYARLDPDLEVAFQKYRDDFEYPPELARVIERALKELFEKAGHWPPEDDK